MYSGCRERVHWEQMGSYCFALLKDVQFPNSKSVPNTSMDLKVLIDYKKVYL